VHSFEFFGLPAVSLCVIYSYISYFGMQFNFHGIISSCFEPYMAVYIELEEKSLVEQLDKLIQVNLTHLQFGPLLFLRSA
jgi:hypothetical protein